jgi:hypothetical protein
MKTDNLYRVRASGNWDEMVSWCQKNLYHGGYYEPNWYPNFPFICFTDEKEYMLFTLRWA